VLGSDSTWMGECLPAREPCWYITN